MVEDMQNPEELIEDINSGEWSKRRDAVFFLAGRQNGADYLDIFVKMLGDPNWEVRVEAAHAIGKHPNPDSQFELIKLLEDENQTVRRVAAKVLGEVGDERSVQALKKALDDENPYVKKNSAKSLLQIWERQK